MGNLVEKENIITVVNEDSNEVQEVHLSENQPFNNIKENDPPADNTPPSVESTTPQFVKDWRKNVGVKVKIILDDIDDIAEEMVMDVAVYMHVEDKPREHDFKAFQTNGWRRFFTWEEFRAEHPDTYFPIIEFQEYRTIEVKRELLLRNTNNCHVFITRHYRLVHKSHFKLHRFPFDRQYVDITLFTYSCKIGEWCEPEETTPILSSDSVLMQNNVIVEYKSEGWMLGDVSYNIRSDGPKYTYEIEFGLSRIATYYITSFALVIFILVEVSTYFTGVQPDDFGGRGTLMYTVLLTLVAFRFTLISSVPKVNYMTLLDRYMMLGILIVFTVISENYFVSGYFYPDGDDPRVHAIDIGFTAALNVLWLGLNVVFLAGARWGWFYEDWSTLKKHVHNVRLGQHTPGKKNVIASARASNSAEHHSSVN